MKIAGDYIKITGSKPESWRWTVHSRHGRVIAAGLDFYHSRGGCVRVVRRLFPGHQVRDANNQPIGV